MEKIAHVYLIHEFISVMVQNCWTCWWIHCMNLSTPPNCPREHYYIQLFWESLSRIKCTRQSRKVIWDMINTLFLTTVAVDPTFVTFLQHSQTYISGLPYDSFKFLWKTVHLKSPTIPFRIAACTFSDNLSQNSCISCKTVLYEYNNNVHHYF